VKTLSKNASSKYFLPSKCYVEESSKSLDKFIIESYKVLKSLMGKISKYKSSSSNNLIKSVEDIQKIR